MGTVAARRLHPFWKLSMLSWKFVFALLLPFGFIIPSGWAEEKKSADIDPDITATLSLYMRINHDRYEVALSPNGKYLTVQVNSPTKVEFLLIDRITKKVLHRLPQVGYFSVVFTPNSTRMLCLRERKKRKDSKKNDLYVTCIYDVKTGKLLHEIPLLGFPQGIWGGPFGPSPPYAVSNDLFVVAGGTQVAAIYSLKTGKVLGDLEGNQRLQRLSISQDGRWLMTLDGKRNLRIWDVKKRKLDRVLYEYVRDVEEFAISPDGKWCGVVLTGERAEVFDRSTGGMKASTTLGSTRARGLAFSADGKKFIARVHPSPAHSGLFDWGLRVWDWQSDKEVARVLAPRQPKRVKSTEAFGLFYPQLMTSDGTLFLSFGGPSGLMLLDLKNNKLPADEEPDEEPKDK